MPRKTRADAAFLGPEPRHFLKEWRERRGLSQEQLAAQVDLAVSSISQLESGNQGYSQYSLELIAHALGTDAASIIGTDPTIRADVLNTVFDDLRKERAELPESQVDNAKKVLRALMIAS